MSHQALNYPTCTVFDSLGFKVAVLKVLIVVNVLFSVRAVELALSTRLGTVELNVAGKSVVAELTISPKYGIVVLTETGIVMLD